MAGVPHAVHDCQRASEGTHAALATESRTHPPLTGDRPGLLTPAYRQLMEQTYARLPDGYVLPPEFAPLGYEHGPTLAKLVQGLDHLATRPS
ncbi:hypothetical protein OHT76_42150 [Streptomyces sp. NBC_00287]|uniref:hypothetical protein n=1 Tax=Streptomyces sp. NBC_00287 TaxID=2975702 RepID=UPI002E2E6EED|nr:hypothetical protein [Streptomyces sp. NBC_00287]